MLMMKPEPSPSPSPGNPVRDVLEGFAAGWPSWLQSLWLLLIVPAVLWITLPQQVIGGLRWTVRRVRTFRSGDDDRRASRRGRFASAMAARVGAVSEAEEWQDDRFAELDAEVEIYGELVDASFACVALKQSDASHHFPRRSKRAVTP